MIKSCTELFDWSGTCDISNLQTMTVELIIAIILTSIAATIAISFYQKEKSQKKLSDKIAINQLKIISEMQNITKRQEFQLRRSELREVAIRLERESTIIGFLTEMKEVMGKIHKILNNEEVVKTIKEIKEITMSFEDSERENTWRKLAEDSVKVRFPLEPYWGRIEDVLNQRDALLDGDIDWKMRQIFSKTKMIFIDIKFGMIELTRPEFIEELLKDIDELKTKCEDRKKSDEVYYERRLEEYKKMPNP